MPTPADVIITYGDDQSGYPHPDHLKVHDISILAWDRAGDPAWYPELGEPYQPQKLYYSVWAKARLTAHRIEATIERPRRKSPYDDEWLDRPGHDHRITTQLDVGEFVWARSGAFRAHATQVDPTESWWFGFTDDERREAYPCEDWVLAASHVGLPPEGELETICSPGSGVRRIAMTIQYRVAFSKKDEAIEGPDDADVVVTIAAADASLDPTTAYMQGKLKSTGSTAALFEVLRRATRQP